MALLDLFLHNQRVGCVEADPRDRTRVVLDVDPQYAQTIVLSESFATIPGRRPPSEAVSNFLGGYVPEGNHREKMAAKRHIARRRRGGLVRDAQRLRSCDRSLRRAVRP